MTQALTCLLRDFRTEASIRNKDAARKKVRDLNVVLLPGWKRFAM